jgi:hypothetical protein
MRIAERINGKLSQGGEHSIQLLMDVKEGRSVVCPLCKATIPSSVNEYSNNRHDWIEQLAMAEKSVSIPLHNLVNLLWAVGRGR